MMLASLALSMTFAVKYPVTKATEVSVDYFGTKVKDPYRWLEDDNSQETKDWVVAQNKVSEEFLQNIPARARIKERLSKLWNYEKFGAPNQRGGNIFFSKNDGVQNQAVLYVQEDGKAPRVLLDPNTLSKDGTMALQDSSISDDGALVAYAIAAAGSDWSTWRVRDVATGKDLPDVIEWTKFSGTAWAKDKSGVYYARFPAPKKGDELKGVNKNQKVYFHKLGNKQADDVLVYESRDHPDWSFGAELSDDGRYLLISQSEGTERKNRIFVKDLQAKDAAFVPLFDQFDAQYEVLGNDGDTFYVRTDKGAPHLRVIAVSLKTPAEKQWQTVIAESKKDVLAGVSMLADRFVAQWMVDAHETLAVYSRTGKKEHEIKLPALGSVAAFSSHRQDTVGYYIFTSFTYPSAVYRYDAKAKTSTVWQQPKVDFNPADYQTEQVFFPSKDGTKIPMFITAKKGITHDGQNPTYLYGYGGFQISLTPAFSVSNLAWMEMGGIYAQVNLRGGGEYGTEWHDAGRLANKQNVFDDFAAAARWLFANKYTSTPKLAIGGRSNGGLLVGAALTQHPELYGAALPAVGVLDMLRFHKFTIGWAWTSDYGSSDTKEGFEILYRYSPLHNIKVGTKYPATLVTTGDHDDRVVPAHSHKFTATLQAAQAGDAPILTRIDTNAGHGAGKPTTKVIDEAADMWTFLVKVLGIKLGAN